MHLEIRKVVDRARIYLTLVLNFHYFSKGIQQYLGGIRDEENEVPDEMSSKLREKIITIPLDISLKVIEPEINGTDRLVIADSELYVAGLGLCCKFKISKIFQN